MKQADTYFLIGIGGAGMSALARYFRAQGKKVFGYDRLKTDLTEELERLGIVIKTSFDEAWLNQLMKEAEGIQVITTPAVKPQNPYLKILSSKYTVKKRSEVLGDISAKYKCLSVAGTHGKTTISSMLATIFKENSVPMIAFLGGESHNFTSNFFELKGVDPVMIVEADEYDRSFLQLKTHAAVISNVEPDHLDIYGDKAGVEQGFQEFANTVKEALIVHESCQHLFGKADVYGSFGDYSYEQKNGQLRFKYQGQEYPVDVKLYGKHNIENALAAFSLAVAYGLSPDNAVKGLNQFKGVKRRFDVRINRDEIVYVDDYAHHPSEINALYEAVTSDFKTPVLGVFEPHLYSRTMDFADAFRKSLSQFDELILLDLYPAREEPVEGIDSNWLAKGITTKVTRAKLNDLDRLIRTKKYPTVVSIGAGTIGKYVKTIERALLGE